MTVCSGTRHQWGGICCHLGKGNPLSMALTLAQCWDFVSHVTVQLQIFFSEEPLCIPSRALCGAYCALTEVESLAWPHWKIVTDGAHHVSFPRRVQIWDGRGVGQHEMLMRLSWLVNICSPSHCPTRNREGEEEGKRVSRRGGKGKRRRNKRRVMMRRRDRARTKWEKGSCCPMLLGSALRPQLTGLIFEKPPNPDTPFWW